MRSLRRVKFLSTFDREPFIGSVLHIGTLISVTLIGIGLLGQWMMTHHIGIDGVLAGNNVLDVLLADARHIHPIFQWPHIFLHLGIVTVFLIPYARTLASLWYFIAVERNAWSSLFTACVWIMLTYILFLG